MSNEGAAMTGIQANFSHLPFLIQVMLTQEGTDHSSLIIHHSSLII